MTPNQRQDMDRELEMERKFRPLNRIEPKPNLIQIGLWIVIAFIASILILFGLDYAMGAFRS